MTALAVVDQEPRGTLHQIVPASGWWVVVRWGRKGQPPFYTRTRVAAWAVTDTGVEAMVAGDGPYLSLASEEYDDDRPELYADDDLGICDCGRRRNEDASDPMWCRDCGGVIWEDW
ncbi:MAG: hypothetical protein KY447_09370 [Actinobacteria bacterium]|nr:hypothetical protein [Actinomycetota bacterium]